MATATGRPEGYSATQIVLHWTIAVLILVQFIASEGIEHVWDAFEDGGVAGYSPLANLHVAIGMTVLLLAIARVWLRLTRGAPPSPAGDPAPARIAAHSVHGLLYLLIFLLPISGGVAWFGGVEQAAEAHEVLKTVLLVVVVVHVAGALVQQFVMRSGVLMRMFRPAG
jgi:cytochrome b561